jgi:hypothetical protein
MNVNYQDYLGQWSLWLSFLISVEPITIFWTLEAQIVQLHLVKIIGQKHMMNSVVHPSTGNEMQYKDLMKDPDLGPSFVIGLSIELG